MIKSTVLLIVKDVRVRTSVGGFLVNAGYSVSAHGDLSSAVNHIREREVPYIALIAAELTGMHGFEVAERLKAVADLSIIFLITSEYERIDVDNIMKHGEDFVIEPYTLEELDARIQMVFGRMPTLDYAADAIIRVDDYLSIDFANSRIMVGGRRDHLTATESNLLHVLLRHAPRVVQNETLLARVWPGRNVYEDTLRVHMHRLRRKIEVDSHHPRYIRTERGIGYRFRQRPPGLSEDSAEETADDTE